MIKLIKKYDKALEKLYKHVGFVEDWVVYPILDCTDCYWHADAKTVKFAESKEKFYSDGDYYKDEIYTQRFYSKHVYIGKRLTMIFCDPHVDGVRWFKFFDNNKRVESRCKEFEK